MDELTECAELSELLAEVATGGASGPDRARVLRHVNICDACWTELTVLTQVADEVLRIAPEHEPPAGFESAVLARISAADDPEPEAAKRPLVRRLGYVLAAVLAGLGGAGLVWQATSTDRDLAASYRETLDVADGQYFSASDLEDSSGDSAGTVFFYEGSPSWLFAIVRDAPAGTYDIVVSVDEVPTTIGQCEVEVRTCSFGSAIDAHVFDIDEVWLESSDGTILRAPH